MKPQIVEIKSISEAQPKYKTWFKYYDDILISVICTNGQKSYVRRKAKSQYHKTDNEMCFWHSDWQYSKIETNYGIEKTGVKTYEIIIQHDNETHRIDSLVENIAIEFQHSLEVSLNEMNSRFVAHQATGYVPYLVLDFTTFNLSEILTLRFNFNSIERNYFIAQKNDKYLTLIAKLKKWYNSEYFKNANLFVDFQDKMIQLVPKLDKGFFVLERDYFVHSIQSLESQVKQKIEFEKEQKKLEVEQKKEEAKLRKERERNERTERYNELCAKNQNEINNSSEFQFYRQCLRDTKISEFLPRNNQFELVQYSSLTSKHQGLHLKHHIYRYFETQYDTPFFILEYTTFNRILSDSKQAEYLWSEIVLKKPVGTELRTIRFIKKKGEKVKLHSKRFELIEGFLHSINNPALREYDDNGNPIKSEYYLYNVKIDNEEDWGNLSVYCEHRLFMEQSDETKYKEIIEKFSKEDKWDFRRYFFEYKHCKGNDLMPDYMRKLYYEDKGITKYYLDNYSELSL
jgi:hypothetical protein